MIIEESRDVPSPAEHPAPPRPLSAAETLARALGTAPAPDPPAPPEETAETGNDDAD